MKLNFGGGTSVASEEQELFIVGLGCGEEDEEEAEDGESKERSDKEPEQAGLERHHQEDMEPDMHEEGGEHSGMEEEDESEDSYHAQTGPNPLKVVLRLANVSAAQTCSRQRRRKARHSSRSHPSCSSAAPPSVRESALPRQSPGTSTSIRCVVACRRWRNERAKACFKKCTLPAQTPQFLEAMLLCPSVWTN
ncbi:unnamed protein product [Polarella glacialis]|uniref:Uncharacterized protein n=1 Tax=Polarella glacialis TaxID=89957 RepID=A0A813LED1_POLGL|nr:unnamed protein product [Polarella glacialis]